MTMPCLAIKISIRSAGRFPIPNPRDERDKGQKCVQSSFFSYAAAAYRDSLRHLPISIAIISVPGRSFKTRDAHTTRANTSIIPLRGGAKKRRCGSAIKQKRGDLTESFSSNRIASSFPTLIQSDRLWRLSCTGAKIRRFFFGARMGWHSFILKFASCCCCIGT